MAYPARVDPATIGAAALRVVESSGWESWSLREVASAMSVTPNALYRHVDGREGLHTAVAAAAAVALRESVEAEPALADATDEAVAISLAYLTFARDRPHAYRAFTTAKPDDSHPAAQEWRAVWRLLVDRVGRVAPQATDAFCFALWSFLHGRAELARTAARAAPFDAGLEDAVRAIAAGFTHAGRCASPLPVEIQHQPREGHADP